MTDEHDWIDSDHTAKREYGALDMLIGWAIYSMAVIYLIV